MTTKLYVVMTMTVDGPSLEDEGLGGCANFAIHKNAAYPTEEEAVDAMQSLIKEDYENEQKAWEGEEQVEIRTEIESTSHNLPKEEMLFVYRYADLISQTTYRVEEIEVQL